MYDPLPKVIPPISPKEAHAVFLITTSLTSLSVLAALFVIGLYFFLRSHRPLGVNRVSLRLSVVAALADVLFGSCIILTNVPKDGNSPMCTFSVFGYIFFSLLSLFLISCIALNLVILLVYGRGNAHHLESRFYLGSILLASLIAGSGLLSGVYGWQASENTCWFRGDITLETLMWRGVTFYLWISLVILLCFGCVTVLVLHLRRQELAFHRLQSQMDPQCVSRIRSIRSGELDRLNAMHLIRRILFYPLIPIITQTLSVFVELDMYYRRTINRPLFFASTVAIPLQGFLTLIFFLTDPSIQRTLSDLGQEKTRSYLLVPSSSPSPSPPLPLWERFLRWACLSIWGKKVEEQDLCQRAKSRSLSFGFRAPPSFSSHYPPTTPNSSAFSHLHPNLHPLQTLPHLELDLEKAFWQHASSRPPPPPPLLSSALSSATLMYDGSSPSPTPSPSPLPPRSSHLSPPEPHSSNVDSMFPFYIEHVIPSL
ncbi:MAG: hypothetical protein DHS80DRAFT_21835 [Piptocephalis tieghemiana]|nr:MAG: hypothetical protein DHS80DRAFT_21835 [Piptocephalis tieghemiana]